MSAATEDAPTTSALAQMIRRLHHAPKTPREHLENARALRAIELATDELLRTAVANARDEKFEHGWSRVYARYSWAQIAAALGMQRQSAAARFRLWRS